MKIYFGWIGLSFLLLNCSILLAQPVKPQWPVITQQNKPWSRWWWEGSAVNPNDIQWMMNAYQKVGLGGLEVTAIYGVKGAEKQFIDFVSPKWMEMLSYTLKEGERLGLGIDVAQASGWPFGGPWVSQDDASKYLAYKTYRLKQGEQLTEPVIYIQEPVLRQEGEKVDITRLKEPITANPDLQRYALDQVRLKKPIPLQALMAYSDKGETVDLSSKVDAGGKLNWTAPAGNWTLYALFMGEHGKMVERAGPGGEGYAIDHFSKKATSNYLAHFTEAFKGYDLKSVRAFFNDSYEVDDARGEADWTPAFFADFERLRGYDLRLYLPALLQDTAAEHRRVLCDYRETISDLLLENYTEAWHDWAHQKGKIIRNQAHGSPANILDLYAATDIPEGEGNDILRIKFASSAAHVTGKPLASSESATWNDEHFLSNLGSIKTTMDRFLLSGINHMFYHGTAYTPKEASWPGWLFYAAVHFTPNNPFWTDFATLNQYVARCQSFMQQGEPDNDVLLYQPIYDAFSTPGKTLLIHFDGLEKGFKGTVLEESAQEMQKKGYSFDYISDKQIINTHYTNEGIQTQGIAYKTIVIPAAEYIPLETFSKLIELAKQGAKIILYKQVPADVPGLHQLSRRRDGLKKLLAQLHFSSEKGLMQAKLGKGMFFLGNDLEQLFHAAGVQRETMVDHGLQLVRRKSDKGTSYFIVNWSDQAINTWVPLQVKAEAMALYNPLSAQSGYAAVRPSKAGGTEVFLQLKRGESGILQAANRLPAHAFAYPYAEAIAQPVPLSGEWDVQFIQGGPSLPKPAKLAHLDSWTTLDGQEVKDFSGTACYRIHFAKPSGQADLWQLDLGEVHESARIKLNGQEIATLIGPVYQLEIPDSLMKAENVLEVSVSNLMANRIAYMDRQRLPYKIFYNINMSAHLPQNRGADGLFTAANWLPKPSGLMGPVTLRRMKYIQPDRGSAGL